MKILRVRAKKGANCETLFSLFFAIFVKKIIPGLIKLIFEANQETPSRGAESTSSVRVEYLNNMKVVERVPYSCRTVKEPINVRW